MFGIGSTFQGDVALQGGTVFSTDADRFLFRADLTVPQPAVRQELDQAPTVSADVTKGLSVTVLPDGTALAGEATSDLRRSHPRRPSGCRTVDADPRSRSTASRWR